MFDIEHNEVIRKINENHEKGIMHLRYQYDNGATMVSISTEIFANVWSPESLVSDIHIGKLKGHKKAIVDGNYLKKAPFFATIDVACNINIYDIKLCVCLQHVRIYMQHEPQGLMIMSNQVFWVFGQRFYQLDIFQQDIENTNEEQDEERENYPIYSGLNEYMLQQVVVQKSGIRMYDMMTGKLVTIFSNVFKEENLKSDISVFRIDKRHRKAYVANNHGEIFVINCQNGVFLKNVTQYLEDQKNIKRYMADKERPKSVSSLSSSNYNPESEDEADIYQE